MKRTALYITLITLLSSLFCCTPRTHTGFTVDSHFVEDHPDSAMTLLRGIDTQRLSRRNRAQCLLLKGLAEAYTGDTTACKETLERAMQYFDRHGSAHKQAAAWYTYAKAYMQTGNLEEAIRGYTQSAIIAENAIAKGRNRDDSTYEYTKMLLVTVYHTLGLIYFEQGYDAVEPFAKAVEAAIANGNAEQEGYSRFMLASAYCANGNYKQAIETMEPLVDAADTISFRYFAQQIRLKTSYSTPILATGRTNSFWRHAAASTSTLSVRLHSHTDAPLRMIRDVRSMT